MANYRASTNTNNSNTTTQDKTNKQNNTKKMDQLRLLKLNLQTAFAEDTYLAEGQRLKEQLKVVKLCVFRIGTRMPTVSRTEGQGLVPLKTLFTNSASKLGCLICSVYRFNFSNILS
jgi:hypothetical protein